MTRKDYQLVADAIRTSQTDESLLAVLLGCIVDNTNFKQIVDAATLQVQLK